MKTNLITKPRYNHNQTVSFTGGIGKIRNYRPDANTWKYIVEMEMGPLPDFGRIGNETTILLYEAEIHAVQQ